MRSTGITAAVLLGALSLATVSHADVTIQQAGSASFSIATANHVYNGSTTLAANTTTFYLVVTDSSPTEIVLSTCGSNFDT